jgi:long-chain acyl-CoA synthetase
LVYLFDNADTKVIMCEAQYVERIRSSGAAIEHIVCLDGSPEGTMSVDDLIAAGADDFDFESSWRAVQSDDVATLIYTSGTTGNPKGVEMTHANLLFQAFAIDEVLGVQFGDRSTSFLPTAHIADRMGALYLQEVFGTQITTVSDPRAIAGALPDVRPTIWGAVPRVWEKLKAAIEFAAANEPDETKRMGLQWGLAVARRKADALVAGELVTDEAAAEWQQADELVFSKLREKLGLDQMRHAVSGAAPIPKETLAFFLGLGIPIAEVWGMSELSCIATVSNPSETRLGTVGKLVPGMEGRIADDGEFLVRGPLVMKGYRKEPKKTAEAVDDDGWLHTGDVMEIDEDGYLKIVDRKKELIINAAGKNMSPANIENTIKAACPLIGVIVAIGDARPYNTALIVLDAESAAPYAAQRGLSDASPEALSTHPDVIAEIAAGVAQGNTKLAKVEQIKRFRVLPTFFEPGSDEITLTMKLKRKPIHQKYEAEIGELYAPDVADAVHEPKAAGATS